MTKHIDKLGYKNGVAHPPISMNGSIVIVDWYNNKIYNKLLIKEYFYLKDFTIFKE